MSELNLNQAFHSDPVIQIRDLCVDYITDNGDFNAVKSVSFDIGKGEIFGLAVAKVPLLSLSTAYTSRPRLSLVDKFYLKAETSFAYLIMS